MISGNHYVEIIVNGNPLELTDQESLNLRMNSVLYDPSSANITQADYSFSFSVPSTPRNDKALGYANNLSRPNKFHSRYSAEVYADGQLVFKGSMTVDSYDHGDKLYECHLVNIKRNTVEEIFGDATLDEIPWEVEFDGAPAINKANHDYDNGYWFPLVCYGAFQKTPSVEDDVEDEYTSKFVFDKYNKWWIESFYPSLSVTELLRKAFQWKGYDVTGDVYRDYRYSMIYASTNLADEQTPEYNVGNPKFGKVTLDVTFDNSGRKASAMNSQDLSFPYYKVVGAINADIGAGQVEYNFPSVNWWNALSPSTSTVKVAAPTYMYDPGESVIVIPATGWYKITMSCNATLLDGNGTFKAQQWHNSFKQGDTFEQQTMTIHKGIDENTPIEIQLIKNYDSNIELIKGKKNRIYHTGDPADDTYRYQGGSYTGSAQPNREEWVTDFPHQDLAGSKAPTKTDSILASSQAQSVGNRGSFTGDRNRNSSAVTRGGNFGGERPPSGNSGSSTTSYGYVHKDGSVMPYDQAVSEAFICGFSSMLGGTVSVMRDGYSWSRTNATENKVFANVDGMIQMMKDGTQSATTYCKNTYKGSPSNNVSVVTSSNRMSGSINCMVWLEKNDVLEPVVVQRDYGDQFYDTRATIHLSIEAASPNDRKHLEDSNFGYNSPTEFPQKLKLTNFCNSGTSVATWVNNVLTAFNWTLTQEGNLVSIDSYDKITRNNISYAVDLDDRTSDEDAVSEAIEYPRSMSVRYQVNTDEWGFEQSVPSEWIDTDEWKEHGDSGYTVIELSDDTYETSESTVQTNFSYTWYDTFTYHHVDSAGTESTATTEITIPVIEESQYMADGYGYEEAMKHDGYSKTQRFWYRMQPSQESVFLSDSMHEEVFLACPANDWNGFNLSYKDTETSLLTECFDVIPMLSSNYVTLEAYLSPSEYVAIRNGALVHFDSDLYYTAEINGYDPSGYNPTELKLVKKVQ